MSSKVYRLCSLVIVTVLAVFIAWSVIMELPVFVPVAGVVVALLLMTLCRRYTREIMVDERVKKIDEKAAAISYRISTIAMAVPGVIFIAMRQTLPSEFGVVGATLAYSACAIMLIHLASCYFYGHKL